jgi:hypothetical protein
VPRLAFGGLDLVEAVGEEYLPGQGLADIGSRSPEQARG